MFGALGALGVGMGAFGSIMGGESERKMHSYNARLLQQRAEAVEQAGRSQREIMADRQRRLKASQAVGFAKSGALPSSGTPLMVQVEQAGDMQRDILEQQRNTMIQATQLRSQAAQEHHKGRMASRAGYMNAFSTILGGTASLGMQGAFTNLGTQPSGGGGSLNSPAMQTAYSGNQSYVNSLYGTNIYGR